MGILFTAVFSGIEIIWDRQFGFLKETLVAPVSRLKIVRGQTRGRATVALIQGSIVMIGSIGQPTLFLLALGFGLGPTFARAGRGDYVQFLAPGIVFLVCLAAGFRPAQPLLLPLALLFMALIAIMCTAIGTAVGTK